MADRNEYMKNYMREYRAAKRAALNTGQAASIEPGQLARSTTEGQEFTEPGGGNYKWVWWLLAGLAVGICIYGCVHLARSTRNMTPEDRAALVAALTPESTEDTEPVNPDAEEKEETTEGQGQGQE